MKNGFRQSMAWLHAWAGLVVGWVLFAVFVTGTASYYRTEISLWMRPELHGGADIDVPRAADLGLAALRQRAPNAKSWFITLPGVDSPATRIVWRDRPDQPFSVALLDPRTGADLPARDTRGGDFLYRFHYELHMPPIWGRWVVGICAMIMLVAILSGIVTHRRIFSDLFTFRRGKAPRRAWLDAHNVTGVLALPYHLMITYTGLATLAVMYMPWGVEAAYGGSRERFAQERGQSIVARPPAHAPGELAALAPMVREAMRLTMSDATFVAIHNPHDARATVVVTMDEPKGLAHLHPVVGFDGIGGTVIATSGPAGPATVTHATLAGLHEGHFASPALRALFFLSGLMGCAMVATGLVLWSVARSPEPGTAKPSPGFRLVQALNVGTIVGLPIAIAGYFLANRLLPVGMSERKEAEVLAFFGAWLLAALVPLALRPRTGWRAMLGAAAALYLAVPVIGGATTGRHLVASLRAGDAVFVGFDVVLLALGAAFGLAATRLRGIGSPAVPAVADGSRSAGRFVTLPRSRPSAHGADRASRLDGTT